MPQRSPVIFWLLLAATLSVDAVVVSWAYAATLNRVEALYFGLACGQISLISIWGYFSRAPRLWRWLAPLAFAIASVPTTTWLYNRGPTNWIFDSFEMAVVYLSLWVGQMSLIIAGLWFLRHTTFGQRWGHRADSGRWQFSMKHVLVVMTVTPILIVFLREAKIIHAIWIPIVAWAASSALLAVAAATICAAPWHAVLRLAALAALASLFAVVIAVFFGLGDPKAVPINLIQAAVLFVWLQFGGLIPQGVSATDTTVPTSPTQP